MAFFDRFRKKQEQERLDNISKEKEEKLQKDLKLVKKVKEEVKDDSKVSTKKKTDKTDKKESVKISGAKIKSKFKLEGQTVLVKPLITEKISDLATLNKYSFEIQKNANKLSVKKAISSVYGVKVENVRVINVQGKNVRYGRHSGRTKDWKKAIITLAPGEKIELYEGV